MSTQSNLISEIRRLTTALKGVAPVEPMPCPVAESEWNAHLNETGQSINTVTRKKLDVRSFITYVSNSVLLNLDQIEGRHINEWVKQCGNLKLTTLRQKLSSLRDFFGWCIERRYIWVDPSKYSSSKLDVRNMSHEQKEPRHQHGFTDAELDVIVKVAHKRILKVSQKMDYEKNRGLGQGQRDKDRLSDYHFWTIAIPVLRWTGLRISDVCCLEWASVNTERRILTVWTRKKNKRVEHKMNAQVIAAVSDIQVADAHHCFPRQRQIVQSDKRASISKQFADLCKEAGVRCTSVHQIRHLYAQDLDDKGVAKEEIAKAMTHSSVETTEIYLEKPQPQL